MHKTNRVIILKGLPASGKSSWAKEEVRKNPYTTLRVNKDDIRQMIFNSEGGGKKEREVLAVRDALIRHGLSQGKTVIVDDTNLNPIHEETIKKIAEENGVRWDVKFFDVSVDECIDRDAQRTGLARVGRDAIVGMYNQYLKKESPPVYKPELPHAIIVDMDGTLALNLSGRSFYEEEKAINDTINSAVHHVISATQFKFHQSNMPFHTIIVSGRDEGRGRYSTEQWLSKHCISYSLLIMRQAGDNRADNIIKREIYDNHIKDKYNILFVLDDRNSVVAMWRSIGLTCFQVADGNF